MISEFNNDETYKLNSLIPRINVYHKQLFFSDNPIFVEGIFDAQMVQSIQNARGASIASAGSCIIEAGGCEEVNKYLTLCEKFKKDAHFLYDLDSLFTGSLRGCIREDQEISSFLAKLGLDRDFGQYCGALDKALTKIVGKIRAHAEDSALFQIKAYFRELEDAHGNLEPKKLPHARIAAIIEINFNRAAVEEATSPAEVLEVEGRLLQIANALKEKNIILLANGALENYLPSYQGGKYKIDENLKAKAIEEEINYLANNPSESDLKNRYRYLFDAICKLPAKTEVDFDGVLTDVLSQFVLDLQSAVTKFPNWSVDQIRLKLFAQGSGGRERIFGLSTLTRGKGHEFSARIEIKSILGGESKACGSFS